MAFFLNFSRLCLWLLIPLGAIELGNHTHHRPFWLPAFSKESQELTISTISGYTVSRFWNLRHFCYSRSLINHSFAGNSLSLIHFVFLVLATQIEYLSQCDCLEAVVLVGLVFIYFIFLSSYALWSPFDAKSVCSIPMLPISPLIRCAEALIVCIRRLPMTHVHAGRTQIMS